MLKDTLLDFEYFEFKDDDAVRDLGLQLRIGIESFVLNGG